MAHPEQDRQNSMDPSVTFHDDLMNGESQIDIVSWMTLVSYLRLDSSHDWAVDYEEWEKGKFFVDSQDHGPYRLWWHEHHFEARGEQTMIEDRVYYSPPLGLLGRIAHHLFIGGQLEETFHYRAAAVRLRFGNVLPDDHRETSP